MEVEPIYNLKDCFGAKRLHLFVDKQLPQPRRDVIERRSAFKSMLNVAPFTVSNRLLDFIMTHKSYQLREFSYHGKRIVFTTDMVRKVFNVPSGNRHVDLINMSFPCQLRYVYKQDNTRPPIKNAEKVLLAYEDTDDEKTEKKAKLRSKGVMGDDFWISGPLPFLNIVYMDHLEFPPNEYVIDYLLPRACHVKSKDFEFIVATDIDKKKLFHSIIFARRLFLPFSKILYAQAAQPAETAEEVEVNPSASLNEWLFPGFPSSQELEVPARYKHLYDKHKAIYVVNVDATIKNLAANGDDSANPNASLGEQTTAADGEVRMDEADDDNDNDAKAEVLTTMSMK
ncbi:hypothetical protein ACQ4PT_044802 [Festuca glaucescens]